MEEEERLLEEGTHVTIVVVVDDAHVQHVNLITEQEISSAKDVEEEERLLEEGTHVTIAVVVENAHVQHVFPTLNMTMRSTVFITSTVLKEEAHYIYLYNSRELSR